MNQTSTCDVDTKELLVIGFREDFLDTLSKSEDFNTNRYDIQAMDNAVRVYNHLLQLVKVGAPLPSAIICNHDFLTNDNYFLLDNTRKNAKLQLIPFILFAHDKKDFDPQTLLKRGVDDCYIEPVAWRDLRRRIEFLGRFKADMINYELSTEKHHSRIPTGKRIFDILFASSIILALSPVLILIALLIKLTSKGPVIYRSKRVGTAYQVFDFLKFRSMVQDADAKLKDLTHLNHYSESEENEAVSGFVKLNNDPRVTRIGKIIRKTSLDELPQLFNVLRGDMSIVGNRPLPLYEAEQMTRDDWAARFLCPAGITGLWQTCKEGKDNLTVAQRAELDVEYALNYSFILDFKILSRTLPAMIQKES
jgi:lipopolysaccharide/colanic/teichoic acid biosynthesis glycosyltransferase